MLRHSQQGDAQKNWFHICIIDLVILLCDRFSFYLNLWIQKYSKEREENAETLTTGWCSKNCFHMCIIDLVILLCDRFSFCLNLWLQKYSKER